MFGINRKLVSKAQDVIFGGLKIYCNGSPTKAFKVPMLISWSYIEFSQIADYDVNISKHLTLYLRDSRAVN